ncbi:MAG: dihydroorotase family protein [Candidatus Bathyarchaeota archaeon]|nr:dihydroorotase family protein [Candidatus Bathyarchaeota archaeon]
MAVDLILTNVKAYIKKEIVNCSLAIENGRFLKICKATNLPKADAKYDLNELLALPGLIDAHVHLRDEGKAYKEDFYSGTAAAAAGGITTVLDMPNNEPVTMSAEALKARMREAEKRVLVNVGFFSEFPRDIDEIQQIVDQGAVAFKLFMAEQVGGLNIDDDEALVRAFETAKIAGVPVAVHAEDKTLLQNTAKTLKGKNKNDINAFLQAHSESVEETAVRRVLKIVKQVRNRLHFCHVSTRKALKAITEAKRAVLPVTCEATPHHLFLSIVDLKRLGALAVTVPPVREKNNLAALWTGIRQGFVDILASDHAPHVLNEKTAESIWHVKAGIVGLETLLPLLLTEVKRGRLLISDVVSLLAEKPTEIFGLKDRGVLKEGSCADLTVVDLKRKFRIDASEFFSKAKYSPFHGRLVEGKAVKTFVGGRLVFDEGEIVADAGCGKIIRGNKREVCC